MSNFKTAAVARSLEVADNIFAILALNSIAMTCQIPSLINIPKRHISNPCLCPCNIPKHVVVLDVSYPHKPTIAYIVFINDKYNSSTECTKSPVIVAGDEAYPTAAVHNSSLQLVCRPLADFVTAVAVHQPVPRLSSVLPPDRLLVALSVPEPDVQPPPFVVSSSPDVLFWLSQNTEPSSRARHQE